MHKLGLASATTIGCAVRVENCVGQKRIQTLISDERRLPVNLDPYPVCGVGRSSQVGETVELSD